MSFHTEHFAFGTQKELLKTHNSPARFREGSNKCILKINTVSLFTKIANVFKNSFSPL